MIVAAPAVLSSLKKVTPAPRWLEDRMEKVRSLPPPSLEEVREMWKAMEDYDYVHRYDNIWSVDSKGRKVIR